jgi:4-hydroxy-3-polyprenylbenzoate decarboxylase
VADSRAAGLQQGSQGRNAKMTTQRLIVGITGASGAAYGVAALKALRAAGIESHLVISRSGQITAAHELDLKISEVTALADVVYKIDDIAAAISSGSFHTMGMLIAPCSIRTLSEISSGVTSSLLTRAADVVLKERRRLLLMVRETPYHLGHLRSMTQVTEMGAIVMPPVPAFYTRPATVDDIVDHSVGRALDLFGLDTGRLKRWGEDIGVGTA